jgi:hypothetical protein
MKVMGLLNRIAVMAGGFVPRIRRQRKVDAFVSALIGWQKSRHGRRTAYKTYSKPNGGRRNKQRTHGQRTASLRSRSNRRKAA